MDKKINLPTIQDLYGDKEMQVEQQSLNKILNAEPKAEWVKVHPFVKNLKYIPIERIEYLLTMIFTKWRVEVKEVKLIANSVVTTVRVYVQNPINGEMDWQDGIGAMPIQVQKGEGATNFEKMNSSAIQIGAPASESYAIKDAVEKFGKIFGKDLNRKDIIGYQDAIDSSIEKTKMANHTVKSLITKHLKTLGVDIEDKQVVNDEIKRLTGLDSKDEKNHIEIENRLNILISENESN
jgi:hypothetical protein